MSGLCRRLLVLEDAFWFSWLCLVNLCLRFYHPLSRRQTHWAVQIQRFQLAERQEGSCIYCELTHDHARNQARALATCFLAANLIPGGPKIILPQPQNFHHAAYTLQIRIAGGPKIWTLARRPTLKGWWIGFATPELCLRWLLRACSRLAQKPYSISVSWLRPMTVFRSWIHGNLQRFPPKMAPNNEVFRRGHLYWLIPYLS